MKLVCPHCGHDGTPETSRPPLGSWGFNFLTDDVVCRDVEGYEENGRLRVAANAKCAGGGVTNPRIECRSCWLVFRLPESAQWEVSPAVAPAETPASPAVSAAGPEAIGAAGRIAENLALLLRQAVEELRQPAADSFSAIQAGLADVHRVLDELPRLREEAARARQETGSLAENVQSLRGRMGAIETAMGSQAEDLPRVREQLRNLAAGQAEFPGKMHEQARALADLRVSHMSRLDAVENRMQAAGDGGSAIAELQREQQALLARLNAQAEAIRVLHVSAHERIGHKEELQEALQRLEQIAGALEAPKPLPEKL